MQDEPYFLCSLMAESGLVVQVSEQQECVTNLLDLLRGGFLGTVFLRSPSKATGENEKVCRQ